MKKKIFALASIVCALTMCMAVGCNNGDNNTGDTSKPGDDTTQNPGDNTGDNNDNDGKDDENGDTTPTDPETITFDYAACTAALGSKIGADEKLTEDATWSVFTFGKGMKFESKYSGINTQGKTMKVKISCASGSISFTAKGASSTSEMSVTIKNAATDATVLETVTLASGVETPVEVENLPAGEYNVVFVSSARLSNLVVVA